jgi:uncharacterized glyoxalase superfamily metalloenzyme YdcJ
MGESFLIPVRLLPYPFLQLRAISEAKLAITSNDAAALQCSPLRLQQLLMAMLVTKDSKLQNHDRVWTDENEVLKRQMETLRQQIDQQAESENQLSQELANAKNKLRLQGIGWENDRVQKRRAEERVKVLERTMRDIGGSVAQAYDSHVPTPVVVIYDDDEEELDDGEEELDEDEEELDAPKPPQGQNRKRKR